MTALPTRALTWASRFLVTMGVVFLVPYFIGVGLRWAMYGFTSQNDWMFWFSMGVLIVGFLLGKYLKGRA